MTEPVYLLGHNISHSKSPVMHNALYKHLGLTWEYLSHDIESSEEARDFIDRRAFLGMNITTPHKPVAYEAADIRAASAKLARGANVLVNKEGRLIAYNMDGEGCVSYLEQRGVEFRDRTVVVCGTGPTALAILHSVALAGAQKVVLIGRNKERTKKVLNRYLKEYGTLAYATVALPPLHEGHRGFREAYDETRFSFGSYRSSKQIFETADIILNATSAGMNEDEKLPLEFERLHEGQAVFDVVYGHGESHFLHETRARGCRAFDGSGMLVAQAVATAKVFFEIAGIDFTLSDSETFSIMADAADFEC